MRRGASLSWNGPADVLSPEDFRGDALANLALGVAVFEERVIGMRVHVDESRRHDQAAGVDLPLGRPQHLARWPTILSPRTATSP